MKIKQWRWRTTSTTTTTICTFSFMNWKASSAKCKLKHKNKSNFLEHTRDYYFAFYTYKIRFDYRVIAFLATILLVSIKRHLCGFNHTHTFTLALRLKLINFIITIIAITSRFNSEKSHLISTLTETYSCALCALCRFINTQA